MPDDSARLVFSVKGQTIEPKLLDGLVCHVLD